MKRFLLKLLWVSATTLLVLFLLGLVGAALPFLGPLGLPFLLLLVLAYGWVLYAYLHYRHGRQEEVVQLLATAAEAGAPLGPAVAAYSRDRPEEGWRKAWVITVLFIILPGYYWVWHRRRGFDQKVKWLAQLLDRGLPLHVALQEVPGLVPGPAVLGAAVGESTGNLADCLRRSIRGYLGLAWMEALPRLLYPLGLLLFVLGIAGFWTTFLLPRMRRIFLDMGLSLPHLTEQMSEVLDNAHVPVVLALMAGVVLLVLLIASPTLRWYTPLVGRLYRMSVQSRVMTMLGVLLEAGRTVPDSLDLIAAQEESGAFVWRRLHAARRAVLDGEPLAESLGRTDLLPGSAVPLVQASLRVQNLPWALAELGDQLAVRTVRLSQRISLTLFPVAVMAVGLIVGVLVLGIFLPLVKLIAEMSG